MHSRSTRLFFVLGLLAPATALAAPKAPQFHPRDMEVFIPPSKVTKAEASGSISHVIYLNNCKPNGCVISPGNDNAQAGTSSIVQKTSTFEPFMYSDQMWQQVVDCVKEVYLPLNVQIVTTRPTSGAYHMDIVAGTSSDANLPADVGGIATISCMPLNNQISFDFANSSFYSGSNSEIVNDICWTAAQESAHAFSLDHEYGCPDPMTYIPGCGRKFFRDTQYQCAGIDSTGNFSPEPCRCGGATQDSYRKLLAVFGKGQQPPAPTVSFMLPHDGDMVMDGYTLYFNATDDRGVDHADIYINGWKYGTVKGHDYSTRDQPYSFVTPKLPDGYEHVTVKAYNDMKSETDKTITVLKGSPCTTADQCTSGQQCVMGACTWPAPTGQLGDTCQRAQDCVSHLCGTVGSKQLCTQTCAPSVPGVCPMGYKCLASGSGGACWPDNGGGGCLCTVGAQGDGSFPFASLALFFAALLLVRRRRHSHCRSRG